MLNELAKEVHEIAVSKGFWDKERNLSEVLLLIISEVVEALEEYRDGRPLTKIEYESKEGVRSRYQSSISEKPVGFPTEVADTFIRMLDMCAAYNIDIDKAVREKIEYNKIRGPLHGKMF